LWKPNLSALVRSPLSRNTQNAGDATQVLSIYALLGRGKKYRGVIVAPPVEKSLTFVFLSLLYYYYSYFIVPPNLCEQVHPPNTATTTTELHAKHTCNVFEPLVIYQR